MEYVVAVVIILLLLVMERDHRAMRRRDQINDRKHDFLRQICQVRVREDMTIYLRGTESPELDLIDRQLIGLIDQYHQIDGSPSQFADWRADLVRRQMNQRRRRHI